MLSLIITFASVEIGGCRCQRTRSSPGAEMESPNKIAKNGAVQRHSSYCSLSASSTPIGNLQKAKVKGREEETAGSG